MAPQEVAGLQALAKAHGGTLTVNPDTGLPEAGFLSSILPLAVGAFLGPAGFGLTAMQAGLAAGAVGTLATGSLSKGLMAGLGAYGGAGLAGSLVGAGSAAGLGAAGAEAAAAGTAAETAALAEANAAQAAMANSTSAANAAASATPEFAALNATPTQFGAFGELPGSFVPPTQAGNIVPTTVAMPELSSSAVNQMPVQEMLNAGFTPEQIAASAQEYAANTAGTAASPFTAGTRAALDSPMKAGFGELMKRPGDFMTKENLKYGLMGLAPVAMDMMTPKQQAIAEQEKRKPYMYAYDPGRVAEPYANRSGAFTGEVLHFDPRFTRIAAGGGLMDIGPIEAMSDRNQAETMMSNGGMRFAEGGETKAVKPVEQDPYYTMSGQSGDAFKYLMGQMPAPSRAPAPAAVAAPVVPVQSTVQAAPVEGRKGFMGNIFGGKFFGQTTTPGSQSGQDGEWVDDTSGNIKPYSFDPNTGMFTAVAPKKVFRPYEPEPTTTMDYGSFTGGGYANGGIASLAQGGVSHLGDYSDGGRLLKGPGNGTSDDIPASIGDKRPARLADGEFVIPSRIVSELGNGSTEAGARQLYAMMDRVQKARAKTTGKNKVAFDAKARNLLPA
jgi:hypothetical protein